MPVDPISSVTSSLSALFKAALDDDKKVGKTEAQHIKEFVENALTVAPEKGKAASEIRGLFAQIDAGMQDAAQFLAPDLYDAAAKPVLKDIKRLLGHAVAQDPATAGAGKIEPEGEFAANLAQIIFDDGMMQSTAVATVLVDSEMGRFDSHCCEGIDKERLDGLAEVHGKALLDLAAGWIKAAGKDPAKNNVYTTMRTAITGDIGNYDELMKEVSRVSLAELKESKEELTLRLATTEGETYSARNQRKAMKRLLEVIDAQTKRLSGAGA